MTWDHPLGVIVWRRQGLWYSRRSGAITKWKQPQLLWNHVLNTTWDHRPRCWPNPLAQLGFISLPRSPRQIKQNLSLSSQRLLKRPGTVPPRKRIPVCWLALEREGMGLRSVLQDGLKTGKSREEHSAVTKAEIQSWNSKNLVSRGGRDENLQTIIWGH